MLSPYARAGHVSSALHSHVSIVRFCEQTFGLAPVTPRTAAADAMDDCFDFAQRPLAPPSTVGPTPTPTPTPTPPPAHLLREIHAAAARASARIAAAAESSTDSHVLAELRYAARDVDRITTLSAGS